MFDRVAVVGAGVAGVAACWAAQRRGAEVLLIDAGPGASCLYPGAVDDRPWEQVARATEVLGTPCVASPLPDALRAFVADLGCWRLADEGQPVCRLATDAGRLRLARGHDRGVLDLSRLPPRARVLLPRVPRPEWDADSLAPALAADAYARSRGLRFEPVDGKLLEYIGEDRIASAELARRHDEQGRRDWLAERLAELLSRSGRADAVLLGPWLGTRGSLAGWLSQRIGVPAGEVVAGLGCAAGCRFESARARLLDKLGVELSARAVLGVERSDDGMTLSLHGASDELVDAVVLAVGGLASGGLVYDAAEQHAGRGSPPAGCPPFRLSLLADAPLVAGGMPLPGTGSLHGPALDEVAWPIDADPGFLESVGVACEGIRVGPALYAAGDVVADQPRTVLQAAHTGILAGQEAAGEPGELSQPVGPGQRVSGA